MTVKHSVRIASAMRPPAMAMVVAVMLALLPGSPASGQTVAQAGPATGGEPIGGVEHRFRIKGLPDVVLPAMDPVRGRRYFATRACVVCHSVNGVGGTRAPALDLDVRPDTVDVLGFVTRMWRGARSMTVLQTRLLGEQIDLTKEELGDIIAFLHIPAEQKRFSEADIPKFIKDFMAHEAKRRGLK